MKYTWRFKGSYFVSLVLPSLAFKIQGCLKINEYWKVTTSSDFMDIIFKASIYQHFF